MMMIHYYTTTIQHNYGMNTVCSTYFILNIRMKQATVVLFNIQN